MSIHPEPAPSAEANASSMWMAALARGEEGAMDCLLHRWWKPLMAYFIRSTVSAADAEDLTLATLTKLYHAAPRYRPQGSFASYLFTIARNVLLSHLRKEANSRRHLFPLEELSPTHQPQTNDVDPALAELKEQFEHALQSLPEVQRTTLLLRVQQDLAYEAIAEITGQTVSATKTCLHRARQTLKAQLRTNDE